MMIFLIDSVNGAFVIYFDHMCLILNRFRRKAGLSIPESWNGKCDTGIIQCTRWEIPHQSVSHNLRFSFIELQG